MLADGLEFYDIPGGIKISEEQLQNYLNGKKRRHSPMIEKGPITLPESDGEAAFIERALQRRLRARRKKTLRK